MQFAFFALATAAIAAAAPATFNVFANLGEKLGSLSATFDVNGTTQGFATVVSVGTPFEISDQNTANIVMLGAKSPFNMFFPSLGGSSSVNVVAYQQGVQAATLQLSRAPSPGPIYLVNNFQFWACTGQIGSNNFVTPVVIAQDPSINTAPFPTCQKVFLVAQFDNPRSSSSSASTSTAASVSTSASATTSSLTSSSVSSKVASSSASAWTNTTLSTVTTKYIPTTSYTTYCPLSTVITVTTCGTNTCYPVPITVTTATTITCSNCIVPTTTASSSASYASNTPTITSIANGTPKNAVGAAVIALVAALLM